MYNVNYFVFYIHKYILEDKEHESTHRLII